MLTKWCGKCKQERSLFEFAKNRKKKDGLQERCTPCRKTHHLENKHNRIKPTREQKRRWMLTSKYGLDSEAFDLLVELQADRCAICQSKNWGHPSPLVDHDHRNGRIRGLLCNNCNRALGLFKDNVESLYNAAEYLRRNA